MSTAQPLEVWRRIDALIKASGVPYDFNTRGAQHRLVEAVARECAGLSAEQIKERFGL